MGTKRWNVSDEKETLHGNPFGYGKGIKGDDEKKQKKAFDRNKKKADKGDKSAYEPTAIDKKVMKKREKGDMPDAKKSKYTEGLFDFNPRKKIIDPSMFSSKKDDIAKLIQFQQKALAMKPGDPKRTAMMKEIQKVKQRLGISEEVWEAVTDTFQEDCWPGYKAVGMKDKNGKKVPNCVPEGKKTYKDMTEDSDKALANKAKESGEPLGDLKKVYKKGLAAYASGHRPGMTQHQWAMARVNSYIKGGPARKVDAHIRKESFSKFRENACEPCGDIVDSVLIESNEFRVGSKAYFNWWTEVRKLYNQGKLELEGFDLEIINGDIGNFAEYEGNIVPLDCPMMEEDEKQPELNKPKKGGPKKYYVYVKDGENIKKVSWGDTTGLKVKLDDPEARKNFASRHDCANKKDKTQAGYWACNLPRYAKQLGLSGGGNFYW